MTTTYWNPDAHKIPHKADTLTIAGTPATGNTVYVVINDKILSYTLTGSDTTATTASGLLAVLQSTNAPAEFQEIAWSVLSTVVTGTAKAAGTPFALTVGATGGGATITHANIVVNVSPSDVNNANNWLRNGSASLPQNGDDVVVQNSATSMLWNLNQLAAVAFNSFTRWQSMTGTIGLPAQNPNGYIEYGPAPLSSSPGRERR